MDEMQERLVVALGIVTDMMRYEDREPEFEETELARVVADGKLNDADIVWGLIDITRILLVKLEKAGQPIDAVLADIGTRYRRDRPGR